MNDPQCDFRWQNIYTLVLIREPGITNDYWVVSRFCTRINYKSGNEIINIQIKANNVILITYKSW